ncbi:site-specific integrase [Ruminiclostridium cellobioparum]|uniref:Integrase family protein n=1 Tax=Ruminiclostridium cellobioparum subsp. termitidis CT1112 TaxID=1195236 RepID=S0FS14_RUMCE|nr:site-specific integrase [Ruminiclostridium cellobioparum]EMS71273.1 integrase family protein [Ruminiclostridium cellobioparum subsp. termitidis CT1112]
MIETSFYNRFTYQKTKIFWDIFDKTSEEYSSDSLNYITVKRDKVIFQLCYSYGLRIEEVLNLTLIDCNFSSQPLESYGSIYIQNLNSRLIYPLFHEATEDIRKYLDIISTNNKLCNNKIFSTIKGNILSKHYMENRLRFYNSKLSLIQRIESINLFRQYYIADILRIKGLSQNFINNQIGNNITNNQVYLHLQPDKTCIGVKYV